MSEFWDICKVGCCNASGVARRLLVLCIAAKVTSNEDCCCIRQGRCCTFQLVLLQLLFAREMVKQKHQYKTAVDVLARIDDYFVAQLRLLAVDGIQGWNQKTREKLGYLAPGLTTIVGWMGLALCGGRNHKLVYLVDVKVGSNQTETFEHSRLSILPY
jgi:hypothetical protein